MFSAYILGAAAFLGGTGLMISSGWLITMAASQPPVLTLTVSIVMVRFFGIGRSVARYFERVVSHKVVFSRLSQLRVALYRSLTSHSVAMTRDLNSGSLVKKVVDDVERSEEYQLRIKLPHASAWLSLIGGLLLGSFIKPESLYVTVTASLILLLFIPRLITRYCEKSARSIEELEGIYAAEVASLLYSVTEARIYGYLDSVIAKVGEIEEKIKEQELFLLRKSKNLQALALSSIGASLIGLSVLVYLAKRDGNIPNVQVTMLIFLPLVMFEAITAWYPNLFSAGKLSIAKRGVDEILKSEIYVSPERIKFTEVVEKIELKDVEVNWGKSFMVPVTAQASIGAPLLIKGRSGSGKSTLAMGLIGALDYRGSIKINGIELRTINNQDEIITASIQQSHIFNTSIRENLKIAAPNASDEELMRALSIVELDELVCNAEGGLDCIIGSYGRAISGGEAKRLSLARVLLSSASIVILDEPTEHLDAELAARIEDRVLELLRNRVLIVITHSGWSAITEVCEIKR